ncbi:molybdate ABC transporter substrate-binding protein [Marinicella rhabdoformis]|uniref:molybdate ABC transporter substrate-binding protein n=1 Tax=Marinicella rhabdoformis TaxID=2580566 RepID=UPI0012AEBF6A|nr:molybdate ABC transporter substrate-binding protein [Marinicella rhabdoformis]
MKYTGLLALFVVLVACQQAEQKQVLRIAVASNFYAPMQVLAEQFSEQSGVEINLSAGATGQLFTQISQGAPFDVFLAADVARPLALEQQGLLIKNSRFTYVEGRLVLWSLQPFESESFDGMSFEHLAIANPKLAPYGVAAVEALKSLADYQAWQGRLVYGQNIAQAQQFVVAGQADAAIISLSQAKLWDDVMSEDKGQQKAYYRVLPFNSYKTIKQQAVQISDNPRASQLMAYLRSDNVKKQLQSWGYEVEL